MAKKSEGTEVTVRVLRTFRDKYTNKLIGKGTMFPCDEKRVAEINFGQAKPIVEIVGNKKQEAAQSASPAAAPGEPPATQGEPPAEPGEPPAEPGEPPAAEQGEPPATPGEPPAESKETKGKGKKAE